jgi:hypothetical protein
MRRTLILTAATVLVLGGLGTYTVTRPADAQAVTAPPMADGGRQGDNARQGGSRWGMASGRDHRHGHRRWMMAQRTFGLFYPVADKDLSVTDVQTIAQAMLLRHGNHSWKVANVTQNQDNTVSFAFATADGGVVARFAIDTHTGRIRRTGYPRTAYAAAAPLALLL